MSQKPIELHAWPTPNGFKVSIALEEMELPYEVKPVNIGEGQQFDPEFLKISPNNKIPAIVDPHGPSGKPVSVFESGAILLYLAEKSGKLLPEDGPQRVATMEWLMWQMGGFGPMLGQLHHFRNYAPEKIEYAYERYFNEAKRLYGVLDQRLAEIPYVAGDTYTIADMAIYPWAAIHDNQGIDIDKFKNVKKWLELNADRFGVQRGMQLMQEQRQQDKASGLTEEKRRNLFGQGRAGVA